jgi:hypothetical protein
MDWLFLLVAGLCETAWAIGLKYTEGFSRLLPTIGTVAAMAASTGFLGLALSPDFSHYLCTIPGFARRVDSRFRNVLARGAGGRERGWDSIGAAGGSKRLISVGLG